MALLVSTFFFPETGEEILIIVTQILNYALPNYINSQSRKLIYISTGPESRPNQSNKY